MIYRYDTSTKSLRLATVEERDDIKTEMFGYVVLFTNELRGAIYYIDLKTYEFGRNAGVDKIYRKLKLKEYIKSL